MKVKDVVKFPEGAKVPEETMKAFNFIKDWDFSVSLDGVVGARDHAALLSGKVHIQIGPLDIPWGIDKEIPIPDYEFHVQYPKE